jgi:hypothetical protein
MKPNSIKNGQKMNAGFVRSWLRSRKARALATAALISLISSALTITAHAQTQAGLINKGTGPAQPTTNGVTFSARGQDIITVPPGFSGTIVTSNRVLYWGPSNGVPVQLNVSGLPSGLTVALATNGWSGTNNLTTLFMTNTLSSVAKGVYTYSLCAVEDPANGIPTNWLNYTLQVADIWNGTTNAAQDGAGNWSSAANWMGGVPGASDDVVFGNFGGQTNSYLGSGALLINSIVDQNTEIASLRFSQTNTPYMYHTLQIGPNKTLKVTGPNGFSILQDYVSGIVGVPVSLSAAIVDITGSGSTLLVSNSAANFATLVAGASGQIFSMTNLDTCIVNVHRIGFGDFELYPNYHNFNDNNNYAAQPRQFLGSTFLARTNLFTASYADPNNYNVEFGRDYSITFGNVDSQGSTSGQRIILGQTNLFLGDSVCFGHQNYEVNLTFSPQFATNYPFTRATNTQYAVFRSPSGGRMSMFAVSDEGGTNWAQSNMKQTVDFGSFNGYLDLLADRFIIARDRTMITSNQTPNIQGQMYMGKGIADVNNAILGYQEHDNKTNWTALGSTAAYLDYCQGTLTVSNAGLFKINQTLMLGYTADTNNTNSMSTTAQQYNTRGVLNINSGATVTVSNVVVDPGLGLSLGDAINMNVGNLIVSNTIGTNTAGNSLRLHTLSMQNGSVLTLHVDMGNSNPYVYVLTNTTTGTNYIQIAHISNLAQATVPIISYSTAGGNPTYDPPIMPPGVNGFLTIPGDGFIYLNVLTNLPKHITWRGSTSSDWNLTSTNWVDDNGHLTNFLNGDFVSFDDAAGISTSINLAYPVLSPGGVTMTNSLNSYVFSASGNGAIQGSASLSKWGTGTLTITAPTALQVVVNQGTLLGSGKVGSATLAPGATMTFSGTADTVSSSGVAVLSGTVSGALSATAGGIITNTGTVGGSLSFITGGLIYNNGNLNHIGTSTVSSNATLINDVNGSITGDNLNVSGTFEDMGGSSGISLTGTLTVNASGTFIPGGDSIGTTIVSQTGTSADSTFAGRVLFAGGSTNIFKVNTDTQASTLLESAHMSLGPSQNTKSFSGGTIQIVKLGSSPFTAGQSFKILGNSVNGGNTFDSGLNSTNSYPVMNPNIPAVGLAWNLQQITPQGNLNIIAVPSTPTNVTGIITVGLVPVGTNSVLTNAIVTHLTWPTNYTGWSLLQQQNDSTVGLSTNWSVLFGSSWTNEWFVTNILSQAPDCQFFRLSYP